MGAGELPKSEAVTYLKPPFQRRLGARIPMASTSSHCFSAAEIHLVLLSDHLWLSSKLQAHPAPLPQLFFILLGCRAKGPGLCAAGSGPVLWSGPCSQGGQAGSTVSRRLGRAGSWARSQVSSGKTGPDSAGPGPGGQGGLGASLTTKKNERPEALRLRS